ncbi:MAG: hypothetical protein J7603_24930 [Pseudacidovorax sp.]|nr:hypothetical protein [Pseudacidovorax sp.]
MNETDWNTPRNGDFVRYVEQLTAESLQRVHARADRPSAAAASMPPGAASPGATSSPGPRGAPGDLSAPPGVAGWAAVGIAGLLVLWAIGAPVGVLVLLAALGAALFKRFVRRGAAVPAARQLLAGLRQGPQNGKPRPPAGGTAARPNPRRQSSP